MMSHHECTFFEPLGDDENTAAMAPDRELLLMGPQCHTAPPHHSDALFRSASSHLSELV